MLQQCKPTAKLTADDARKMKVAELRTELANRDIACKGELKAGLVIAVLRGVAPACELFLQRRLTLFLLSGEVAVRRPGCSAQQACV